MPSSADVELQTAVNVPTGDSGTAGGGSSGNPLAGVNEDWFPFLSAPMSGTLDTDAAYQWQGAAVANKSGTNDLQNVTFHVRNLLAVPGSAQKIRLQPTDNADNASKKLRCWSKIGGALLVEDILLGASMAETVGVQNVAELYRARTLVTLTDVGTTLVGDLTISSGNSGPGTALGVIPAGKAWASNEFSFAWAASLDDTTTWTNRKTNPGLTYARCNADSPITCPNVITAGSYNSIVGQQKLQPAMPLASGMRFAWEIGGEFI